MDFVKRITSLPFALSDAIELAQLRYGHEYSAHLDNCLKEVVRAYKLRGEPYAIDDPACRTARCGECRLPMRDGYFVIVNPSRGRAPMTYLSYHLLADGKEHRRIRVTDDLDLIKRLLNP